tara:strand:- start:1075 stop:2250 length:1176 start_codon:yes stop_codon:yes gene_type:complete
MTKKIFEELPARKHSPAAAPAAKGAGEKRGGEGEGSEKRIRQAVYDIRYRARREGIDLRAAYSQYMQNSNLSAPEQAAVRAKLFGKDGGGDKRESYDSLMTDGASNSVASAMFKVFVEKAEPVQEDATSEKKYKVRVTDKKTGRSYVRYADRSKITELRGKGLDVEMTEHGDPYEGNRAKKDYDGDGKVESSSKEHAGAVHNAIQRAKGGKADGKDTRKESIEQVWEAFLADGAKIEAEKVAKKAGPVDNYKSSCVKVMPDMKEEAVSKAQQRFMGMVRAEQKGEMKNASPEVKEAAASMKKKDVKKYAETKHDGLPEKKEVKEGMGGDCGPKDEKDEDRRDRKTYRELLKNKLRAMGIKNPMVLGDTDEKVMKIMTRSDGHVGPEGEDKK